MTRTTASIAGQTRTFDWTIKLDPKSLEYKIERKLDTSKMLRSRNWTRKIVLDQGREGACVGFSCASMLASTPRARTGVTGDLGRSIYYDARRQDEWPGEDYEGSSINGGMKALRAMGEIDEWLWATTMQELRYGVCNYGPMVIGIDWYESYYEPQWIDTPDSGRIPVLGTGGSIVGGHAIEIVGYDLRYGWWKLGNTWGEDWGDNGFAWMSDPTMEHLMNRGGEFALPRKVKK